MPGLPVVRGTKNSAVLEARVDGSRVDGVDGHRADIAAGEGSDHGPGLAAVRCFEEPSLGRRRVDDVVILGVDGKVVDGLLRHRGIVGLNPGVGSPVPGRLVDPERCWMVVEFVVQPTGCSIYDIGGRWREDDPLEAVGLEGMAHDDRQLERLHPGLPSVRAPGHDTAHFL